MEWQELGDRIFRHRYASLDLNVGLILGEAVAMVVDSRASHSQADELIEDIRAITSLPVAYLVNTHHHWDHTFGNARFLPCDIIGHVRCRTTLVEHGEEMRTKLLRADWMPDDAKPHIAEVDIEPPTTTFDRSFDLDLGDRSVLMTHLGRGHTDNDIVIEIDSVLFAGDLVEEGAPPQFGDAFPHEWPATLDALLARSPATIVPGHGDIVDRDFVQTQRDQIIRAIDGEPVFPEPIMEQIRSRL